MHPLIRRYRWLGLFFLAYLLFFAIWAVRASNAEFVLYLVVEVILAGAILVVDLRCRLPMRLLWALAFWGLIHAAGGLVPVGDAVLYNWRPVEALPKFDQVVHAYGFFVATMVGWFAMKAATGFNGRVGFGLWFLLVTIGMGFGALNELVEFSAVLLIPDTNVGGYMNTGWDLVSNMVGSVIAAAVIAWGQRGNSASPASP